MRSVLTLIVLAVVVGCGSDRVAGVGGGADDEASVETSGARPPVGGEQPDVSSSGRTIPPTPPAPAPEAPVGYSLRAEYDGVLYELKLATHGFDARAHKVGFDAGHVTIDGVRAIGAGDGEPVQEIAKFALFVDGLEVDVPDYYWKDCFDLMLGFGSEMDFVADELGVVLRLVTPAGPGQYGAVWTFRDDGRHLRHVTFDYDAKADLVAAIKDGRPHDTSLWD